MKQFSVAIDGPAGAGKSTLAKAAAKALGFVYVDTGAIYRTVGLAAKRAGVAKDDTAAVTALLPGLSVDITYMDGVQHMLLGGEDVSDLIRTPEISDYASNVSAMPPVRAYLMDMQRRMAEKYDVVMDGRDIGTVVLPQAGLKVFLTADVEKRAQRRHKELLEKGIDTPLEEVLADMRVRDARDMGRETAPLKAAEDAVILDTGDMTLEESIEALLALIRARLTEGAAV